MAVKDGMLIVILVIIIGLMGAAMGRLTHEIINFVCSAKAQHFEVEKVSRWTDAALCPFVNCNGALLMISLVAFRLDLDRAVFLSADSKNNKVK